MSVWATVLTIEDERQWIAALEAKGIAAGIIRDDAARVGPDFDDLDAPIVYQGAHVVPDETHERGGSVGLALIPGHITLDGRDDGCEDGPGLPYLRLAVNDACVVLTARQARRLCDALAAWLTTDHRPPPSPPPTPPPTPAPTPTPAPAPTS